MEVDVMAQLEKVFRVGVGGGTDMGQGVIIEYSSV